MIDLDDLIAAEGGGTMARADLLLDRPMEGEE